MPIYQEYLMSDQIMCIKKLEKILSIITSGYQSGNTDLRHVHPTPAEMKRSDMSWHDANLTKLTISHHIRNKELFDFKLQIIEETGWLKNLHVYRKRDILVAEWTDTSKLRIFYDWLNKAQNFTLEYVLNYMNSPFFLTMYILEQGLNLVADHICIYTGFSNSRESDHLNEWIHACLGYETYILKHEKLQDVILINAEYKENLLKAMKQIIHSLPNTYQVYYKYQNTNSINIG
ncbi:hypothetical protein [Lysinibacillus fusiformis]|uniref:Uncharacterized protein n=1 Tax=Lysinibacillus fusiformis TaxID=28031 RepID=A0A1E4QYM0_9BACI|nr:hypothetical protein [Lysinibacillus fusiformis]ODV53278.1 hypothetical protein BG258_23540 [Lysinibacillus fusiformis]